MRGSSFSSLEDCRLSSIVKKKTNNGVPEARDLQAILHHTGWRPEHAQGPQAGNSIQRRRGTAESLEDPGGVGSDSQ